jgi:hypothetical protein
VSELSAPGLKALLARSINVTARSASIRRSQDHNGIGLAGMKQFKKYTILLDCIGLIQDPWVGAAFFTAQNE